MACTAKLQTWRKVFDQHCACATRVRLVTAQASERRFDLGWICRVVNITDRMPPNGVSDSILQLEANDMFLRKIVCRKLYFAIENRNRVCALISSMSNGCTMALGAERIPIGAEQLRPLSSVWVVARRTALLKYRLMKYTLVL